MKQTETQINVKKGPLEFKEPILCSEPRPKPLSNLTNLDLHEEEVPRIDYTNPILERINEFFDKSDTDFSSGSCSYILRQISRDLYSQVCSIRQNLEFFEFNLKKWRKNVNRKPDANIKSIWCLCVTNIPENASLTEIVTLFSCRNPEEIKFTIKKSNDRAVAFVEIFETEAKIKESIEQQNFIQGQPIQISFARKPWWAKTQSKNIRVKNILNQKNRTSGKNRRHNEQSQKDRTPKQTEPLLQYEEILETSTIMEEEEIINCSKQTESKDENKSTKVNSKVQAGNSDAQQFVKLVGKFIKKEIYKAAPQKSQVKQSNQIELEYDKYKLSDRNNENEEEEKKGGYLPLKIKAKVVNFNPLTTLMVGLETSKFNKQTMSTHQEQETKKMTKSDFEKWKSRKDKMSKSELEGGDNSDSPSSAHKLDIKNEENPRLSYKKLRNLTTKKLKVKWKKKLNFMRAKEYLSTIIKI